MFSWPGRKDSQTGFSSNDLKREWQGPRSSNRNKKRLLNVLQAKSDVDKLMQQCMRVWTNPEVYLHTPTKVHLGVNWTTAELITLLRNVGDIGEYKSSITLTIGSDGFSIKSEPDTQKLSRIECTEGVVDKLLPGLLSSAATLLPDPWDSKRRIASEIAPVPSLFEDPATIDLPRLLSPLTINNVVEWVVSDSLPAQCCDNGSVLGCLWRQTGKDRSSFQFQPFDLSLWPAAVKFADEWLQDPAAWWQQIMPSVEKVWVLTESMPECREGGGIGQRHPTCWIVAVLNLFARVPFLFLMLDERLQELVLGCKHIQSDGNNILRRSCPTRQQEGCPQLPRDFHDYMQNEHEGWSSVNVNSGWSAETLLRGMLEFSGYKHLKIPKKAPIRSYKFKSTIDIASDCTSEDCTVLEYKYIFKEYKESTKNTVTPFSLEWLTKRCSGYEAGLFGFWRDEQRVGHAVALTMCQGEVIVCDHGTCMPITIWFDWSGLTTLSLLKLVLYRQRMDRPGTNSRCHGCELYVPPTS